MENILRIGTKITLISNRIVCFSGEIISVNKDNGSYNVKSDDNRVVEIHHNTIIDKYIINN